MQSNRDQKAPMTYNRLEQALPIHQTNARAEDDPEECSPWNSLCEGVLIPLGSLFAVFLAMLILMLIAN
jgi:hypothetical protein